MSDYLLIIVLADFSLSILALRIGYTTVYIIAILILLFTFYDIYMNELRKTAGMSQPINLARASRE